MKSLVIFDSVFGNTELVAQEVGKALGTAEVVRVSEATPAMLEETDLVVMASPTRGFQPMPSVLKFLKDLPNDALKGKKVAAFDTRMDAANIKSKFLRFIVSKGSYAEKAIAKNLTAKGGQMIAPTTGFFVEDTEGPLAKGELERIAEWAAQIKAAV